MQYKKFNRSLTIALPENVYQAIKEVSDYSRISMATTVRENLEESLIKNLESDNDLTGTDSGFQSAA